MPGSLKSFIKLTGLTLWAILLLPVSLSWSEETAAPAAAATAPADAAGASAPPQKRVRRKKFVHTRHTSDETHATVDRRTLVLNTVEDRIVDLDFEIPDKEHIYVGKADIVQTIFANFGGKSQLVLRPMKENGETTVTIRDTEGTVKVVITVRVTLKNVHRLAAEIRNLIRDVEGVTVRVVGVKVVVEGEALVPADYARVVRVVSESPYKDNVINLLVLSPLTMQAIAKKIQEDINLFAENVKTRVVNGKVFLEGSVDSAEKASRAARIAELYLPDPRPPDPMVIAEGDRARKMSEGPSSKLIQNFILISPPPPKKAERLVRLTVHFVELSKDYNKLFGFQWRPGFTSGSDQFTIGSGQAGGVQGNGASFSATISSLFPKLKSAQEAGYARVLNTGTVIVRSGQVAKLAQRTEIPYLVQGPQGAVPGKAEVGLDVSATPMILGSSEDIQLDLDIGENEMVVKGSSETGGAPVIAVHKVTTKIYVKSNESAAVAAINSSRVKTDFNKDPPGTGKFGQGTEELFNLTRTKAYTRSKTQFVIFMTPQIIDNASEGTEDLRKNFRIKVK